MSKDTKIEWCDSTVNPVMGCDGCELWSHKDGGIKACYAGELTQRYGKTNSGYPDSFDKLTKFPGRMEKAAKWKDLTGEMRPGKPWLNGMPRHIFISDMADSLSKAIDFQYLLDEIIVHVTSETGHRHRWLWLTKVPSRMAEFSEWLADQQIKWPDNLMAMTSITSRATMGRLDHLLNVRCKFRGVSFEPLWGDVGDISVELAGYYCHNCKRAIPHDKVVFVISGPEKAFCPHCTEGYQPADWDRDDALLVKRPGIDWAIVGGQSGSGIEKPMHPDWVRNIRDQCHKSIHRTPYFFKQWGLFVPWESVNNQKARRNYHVNSDGIMKPDHPWPEGDQVIMHRIPDKKQVRRTVENVVWSEMPKWGLREEQNA